MPRRNILIPPAEDVVNVSRIDVPIPRIGIVTLLRRDLRPPTDQRLDVLNRSKRRHHAHGRTARVKTVRLKPPDPFHVLSRCNIIYVVHCSILHHSLP